MGTMTDFRRKWFVSSLSGASAIFFTFALAASALNYVNVMDARESVGLGNAIESAELLPNGTLAIKLTVVLDNPSSESLSIFSLNWVVRVQNETGAETTYIPVVNRVGVPPEYQNVPSNAEVTLELEAFVSSPSTLSSLVGYINHSTILGGEGTVADLPYAHDLRLIAWIGDYDHDYAYSKEAYLNDMVRLQLRYLTEEYS